MKKHHYEYDEIVVGGNLAAVMYAYLNQCPIIFKEKNPPHFYEHFKPHVPLENLFLSNPTRTLKTPSSEILVGVKKSIIYERLLFVLSLSGLVPFSNKIDKIRIYDTRQLKVITMRNRAININYKNIRIFDPSLVDGTIQRGIDVRKRLVHDRMKYYAKEHQYEAIMCEDQFINQIHFYKNKRTKGCLVVSSLSEDELNHFDFSIIPLKYKLKYIFEKNNIQKLNSEREIVVDFLDRQVYNQDVLLIEEQNITIDYSTEEEICRKANLHTTHLNLLGVYPWRLNHLLLDSSGTIR